MSLTISLRFLGKIWIDVILFHKNIDEVIKMEWFKKSYAWLILNSIASLIFLSLLWTIYAKIRMMGAYYPTYGWIGSDMFRTAGHWAIRFLLISLAMSPIYSIFGWRKALGLRKSAGLWSFAFAALHFCMFFADWTWPKIAFQPYYPIGLTAISILALMALTSNKWAMRLMKKWWKRLHRLVYVAALLVVLHTILALGHWQKFPDWELAYLEMKIYGLLMIILLLLRIPWVKELIHLPKRKVKPELAAIERQVAEA
jgi:methionine sulfoxide reductase heme-binding subunit